MSREDDRYIDWMRRYNHQVWIHSAWPERLIAIDVLVKLGIDVYRGGSSDYDYNRAIPEKHADLLEQLLGDHGYVIYRACLARGGVK